MLELRCKERRGRILDDYKLPSTGCILVSGKQKYAEPLTITGLALWLDCDKATIKSCSDRDDFSGPVKNAYIRVQKTMELKLHNEDTPAAKVTFGPTNFEGWQNKQYTDNKISGGISLGKAIADADGRE